MSTPLSSAVSYCTPAQAVPFVDQRAIGDIIDDAGIRISPAALLAHPNWLACLQAGSGEVEAACMVNGKYNPVDLAGLTGVSLIFLQKIVARLGYGEALMRRYPDKDLPASVQECKDLLVELRKGEMIFGIVEVQTAGNFDIPPQFEDVASWQQLGLSSYLASRYYGRRAVIDRIDNAQGDPGGGPYGR